MQSDVSTAGADQDRGRTVEELERELAEAREQQTATSAILRAISNSPTDVQPVLDSVAESAARLCEAFDSAIFRRDGDRLLLVAHHGPIPDVGTLPLDRGTINGRAVLDGRTVQVADLQIEADEYPLGSALSQKQGVRTTLSVPLMREGVAIGTINLRRTEAQLFTERQVALLQTFADQAVIAIENTRLFEAEQARTGELQEALEYQTATSDVLNVISRSKFDLQPVLDSIVETAARLCVADMASIRGREGDAYVHLASYGVQPEYADFVINTRHAAGRGSIVGRVSLEGRPVQIADVLADPEYTLFEQQRRGNFRTVLGIPLLREGVQIGIIILMRRTVQPFSDKQIALVETFADQAVIAIENTRLFEEVQARNRALTEAHTQVSSAFERETATSEILRVIGSSPTDVQPVFNTIARSGVNVCGALGCVVLVVDGDLIRVAATHGVRPERLERFHRDYPIPLSAETDTAQAIRQRRMFHLADIENNPNATATDIEHARLAGYRTRLMVPMVRGDRTLGLIAVTREDPTPFPDQLVELLRTFADQAVIAIENTRLFEETREALERQTATAEILQVIGSSPTDTQPVFDAIVNSGVRLFPGAMITVARPDGGTVRAAAIAHEDTTMVAGWRERFATPLSRDRLHAAAILDAKLIDFPDAEAEKDGPLGPGVRNFLLSGNRAVTIMPMLRGEGAIGAISVTRAVPGPLSDKQIAILRTFADQAVIAIENVRLFQEVQARTRELTEVFGIPDRDQRGAGSHQPLTI